MRATLPVLLAIGLLLSSVGAKAAENWYLSVEGGAMFLQDADNSGGGVSIESSYDTGFVVGGAVGYMQPIGSGKFRYELELSYSQADADQLAITNDGGLGVALGIGSLNGLTVDADGDVSAFSGLLNVLYEFDIGGSKKFHPYLGAGVGGANVSADISVGGLKAIDDSDTVFAYQGIAGVAYDITPELSLTFDYRYFATADPSLNDTAGVGFDSEVQSHNLILGLRGWF